MSDCKQLDLKRTLHDDRGPLAPLRPDRSPVSHHAAEALQQLILDGALRAGQRLPSQRDLANELGISRNSLREALTALETLGYLRIVPGRGVFVLSDEERHRYTKRNGQSSGKYGLKEIYQYRYATEGMAAMLLATVVTSGQISELRALVSKMRAAGAQQNMFNFSEYSIEFYLSIVRWSGNGVAIDAAERLKSEIERSCQAAFSDHRFDSIIGSMEEVESIISALADHDPIETRRAVESHIRYSAERAGISIELMDKS
ncbi:GntR family transcriptional regulator [Caballeronia sp. INDeC2]|uniref:FadR/GntR family transcriptional regulator n=1 Tax=Caballeronia sp. INDeC2 TaxID=2921747 RepID=UPI0020288B4A|nr:GntR family transcriptional regulator [Caballeronia sp. INDeC2]